jgi:hypothetical protein
MAKDASATGRRPDGSKATVSLNAVAQMAAGWPTPAAVDATTNVESLANKRTRGSGGINLTTAAALAGEGARDRGWPTPKAEDAESTGFSAKRLASGKLPDNLHSATKLLLASGWATPNHRDYRTPAHHTYAERGGGKKGENLNHQVAHFIPGASLNGLNAGTASGGLLNPDFSRWLQGIPATWPSCAPTATRSIRKSPLK